ncbi:hypothetical protein TNCV_146461, partial [Trichonephila clavipes]
TLGSIPIRRFCVRRPVPGRPRATTPAEDRFLALSARRREEPLLCRSSLQATFKHQEESRCGAKSSSEMQVLLANAKRRPGGVAAFPSTDGSRKPLHQAREHVSVGRSNNDFCAVWTDEYRDETLDPYVHPYAAAIGNDFILMDDNARPHFELGLLKGGYPGGSRFGTNGMATRSPGPESDRTSLGLSWQRLLL